MPDTVQPSEHVTIVKERGGSGGTMIVAVIALLLIAAFAYFVLAKEPAVNPTDASISAAANKVGDAADKVGDAAQDATN
jgi:hypothetical protein